MVECQQVQAALSARLDGEPSPLPDDVVDAHVAECAECQSFLDNAALLNRTLAFSDTSVSDIPDLSEEIMAGVAPVWRRRAASRLVSAAICRVVLVLLGVAWCGWAVALLRLPAGDNDPVFLQLVMETVAMRSTLGFGVVFVAWQSRLVAGLLPVYGALFMFSFGLGVRDLVVGSMTAAGAGQLGLLFVSVVALLWLWLLDKGWAVVRALSARPVA